MNRIEVIDIFDFNFVLHSPERNGIHSNAVADFLSRGNELGLHSFLFLRGGHCVSEAYFAPYAEDKLHLLYSLSKSFTSIACAFAVQDGKLQYEDRVASFFPDKLISEGSSVLTVEHLLTMSVGTDEGDRFFGFDWIGDFLSAEPTHNPGSLFRYDSSATFMVSAILQRVLGCSIECYLTEKLFSKIGIDEHWWQRSPDGICTGGFGLNLSTRSLARFAQFLLNEGSWNEEQLLAPELIRRSASFHIKNGTPVEGQPCDWAMGYGYQFWRCEPEGVFRGDGAFGQYVIVMPKQDAVIAITSGTHNMQAILTAVWRTILPAIEETSLPTDPVAEAKLRKIEAGCHIAFPEGAPLPPDFIGNYRLRDEKISLSSDGDVLLMSRITENRSVPILRAGYHNFIDCGGLSYTYAVKDCTLILREVHNRTPFGLDRIYHIKDGALHEEETDFVGCVNPKFDPLRGTKAQYFF